MALRDDRATSIRLYARHAAGYDESARRTMPLRRRTIAALGLRAGDVVLDIGAGTGLSYELLVQAVGPTGRVLAFEQSPDMFEHARQRAQAAGWPNLWHACASAETVSLPAAPSALLFNYVHDITRSPQALANLLAQAQPQARVAMAGMKYFPWWTGPLNLLAWLKNRPYNVRPSQMWRPWDLVESQCVGFEVTPTQWGMGYIARGRLREGVGGGARNAAGGSAVNPAMKPASR